MIVGLTAATLQGVPVVTQDIDLWFENLAAPGLRAALKTVGGFYISPTALTPPRIGGEAVKMFDLVIHMDGLRSFAEEFRTASSITVRGLRLPVLPLERIIASKRAANRPKDKLTLSVLEDAARTARIKSRAG
jgi:hypothetical protein